jgi:hypothetical protein
MEAIPVFLAVILILAGILITILWIILPFAVFGIKGRIDGIIGRQDMIVVRLNKSIELLTQIKTAQVSAGDGEEKAESSGSGPEPR